MTDASVLDHITRLPHGKANLKQLMRELGSRGMDRASIQSAIERLETRGDLVRVRAGHYVATSRSREYAVGRLQVHREGYGFVIPYRPVDGMAGDLFIPPASAEKAMHGDTVVARIGHIDAEGRAEGEILRVIKRAHPTVVGEFRITRRGSVVVPHDERIQQWIDIPDGMEIPPAGRQIDRVGAPPVVITDPVDLDGMIVNVELIEFPGRGERASGRVIEVLGRPDDFGIDVEIIIRKHHLPHRFPAEVLEEAASIPEVIASWELEGRRDFRDEEAVTIDGETARDFDDAVWVDRLPNGNYELHVHIADVSHYVRPGTPIDVEARLRGTSVYFPDRAVPMLPVELSTGICSLNPQVDRLVLSALMELDHSGDVVHQEFVRGVIRSAERMTYTAVHALLEGDLALRSRYRNLAPRFELMKELALILNRKRTRRGSIDFDLPEPIIEFDEWGQMTGVTRAVRNIAHRIIEEFMLAANEAVASHMAALPFLYRIHEPPDPKRVMEFEEVAATFGYSLGAGAVPVQRFGFTSRHRDGRKTRKEILVPQPMALSSRNYQKLAEKIAGKPEERILSYLMLRSLRQARYSTENPGHFALAAKTYTHFTSPIRRYPDLMVHRLLVAALEGVEGPGEAELAQIADACSATERRADDAERELVEWKKVRFMTGRVGEEFNALAISTTKYGIFVELEDLFIEGLVPIDLLPGDRYYYHENVRQIIGQQTRRTFRIGDRLRVRLDRVDDVERRMHFSLVEPEPVRRSRKRHRTA